MLNIYMVCSRFLGPSEGATLVFAHSVQEARKVGWRGTGREITDDYLDLAAYRLRHHDWLREEANAIKYSNDQAHEICNPISCSTCEKWGQSLIGADNLCDECREAEVIIDRL